MPREESSCDRCIEGEVALPLSPSSSSCPARILSDDDGRPGMSCDHTTTNRRGYREERNIAQPAVGVRLTWTN